MRPLGLGPEFVCESCHLAIRGGIPGVQRVTINVSYKYSDANTEAVRFSVHDSSDCLAPLSAIITEFVLSEEKHTGRKT